jgi:hypothetical protein
MSAMVAWKRASQRSAAIASSLRCEIMLSRDSECVSKEDEHVSDGDDAMTRQKERRGTKVREIAGCRKEGREGESRERDFALRVRT